MSVTIEGPRYTAEFIAADVYRREVGSGSIVDWPHFQGHNPDLPGTFSWVWQLPVALGGWREYAAQLVGGYAEGVGLEYQLLAINSYAEPPAWSHGWNLTPANFGLPGDPPP